MPPRFPNTPVGLLIVLLLKNPEKAGWLMHPPPFSGTEGRRLILISPFPPSTEE
jgi:hypothetical protein